MIYLTFSFFICACNSTYQRKCFFLEQVLTLTFCSLSQLLPQIFFLMRFQTNWWKISYCCKSRWNKQNFFLEVLFSVSMPMVRNSGVKIGPSCSTLLVLQTEILSSTSNVLLTADIVHIKILTSINGSSSASLWFTQLISFIFVCRSGSASNKFAWLAHVRDSGNSVMFQDKCGAVLCRMNYWHLALGYFYGKSSGVISAILSIVFFSWHIFEK